MTRRAVFSLLATQAARHGGPLNDIIPPQGAASPVQAPRSLTLGPVNAATAQSMLPIGQRMVGKDDDVDSGYADPLTELNMVDAGNGTYVHLPQVNLFVNDVCPWQVIEYDPWLLLPTFDESMPGNDSRDRMCSWDGPFTIEIVPITVP